MMEKFAPYEGGSIFYTDIGTGQTIVLIHGYLLSSQVWGKFAEQLAVNYRVITLDLPGNGRSSNYAQNHSMCFYAGAVISILDAEQIEKVTIIGHSLGGYVSLSLVENYKSRLLTYILLHSHPYADTDEVIDNRLREIKVVKAGKKEFIYPVNIPKMFADKNIQKFSKNVEKLKKIASGLSDEGIIAVLKGMIQRKSRADVMYNSDLPMLYILGLFDNYIPFDEVSKKIMIPGSGELVTLSDSGHMGFLEETDLLVGKINHFIQNL